MYSRSRGSGGRKNEIMQEPWQGPLGLGVGVRREAFGGYKASTGLQGEEGETGEKGEGEKGERRGAKRPRRMGQKKAKRARGRKKSGGKKKRGKKRKSARGEGFKDGREVKNFRDGAWRGQERRDEVCVGRKRGKKDARGGVGPRDRGRAELGPSWGRDRTEKRSFAEMKGMCW